MNNRIKAMLIGVLCSLSAAATIDVNQSILNMKVTTDGIYRVTYEEILNLNVDLTGVAITKLALYTDNTISSINH